MMGRGGGGRGGRDHIVSPRQRGRGGGGGGGRDRPYGGVGVGSEYSPRMEERERRTGWDVAPSSRHLWVGNLSLHATQSLLSEQFLRFGDLESIAHVPGRSYAFVNFMKEEDAVMALRGLQGFKVAGAPLRIEFTKGDRAPISSQHEEYPVYNEGRHSIERGEPLSHRDSRPQRPGPERSYDHSRGDKSSEPSEMLWIGFPSFLNVDEMALRRAFSPFGEIEKITTFPGRSYAFVRYRSVVAACRAKEALQGKLFNNPRVNICFANSDAATAEHGRSSTNTPFSPHFRSNFHPGLSEQGVETFQRERSFDSPIAQFHMSSPRFPPNMDRMSGDPNIMGFGRNNSARTGAGPGPGASFPDNFEDVRLQDVSQERRITETSYERHTINPGVERGAYESHSMPLPFERPRRTPLLEDSWGVEDGSFPFPKKLKMELLPDKELPEYPFSDIEHEKHSTGLPKLVPTFPEHPHAYNKIFDSVPFGYKGIPDHSRNLTRPHTESDDPWRTSDSFNPDHVPLPSNLAKLENVNTEPHQPPLNDEWKWEGTIAKGGTPVCRARCFPVGKVLDFMLPEFLNCTARTGLDMLAKHYYQAASTWVVFFVPETDADIVFYNEFMHYLGEKQRAAVAKLGEKITLFLVPPSEFSEQVLKVPGKVSISGVILQFQHPSSTFSSLHHHPLELMESKLPSIVHGPPDGISFHEDTSFQRPSSPDFRLGSQGQNYFNSSSGLVAPHTSNFPPPHKPVDNLPYSGPVFPTEKVPDFHGESRHDQLQHQNPVFTSNWSGYMHPNSSTSSFPPPPPNAASHSFDNSLVEEYPSANSRVAQGTSSTIYTPETMGVPLHASKFPPKQEAKPHLTSSMPIPLQPEQLAQLAALLGQQKQSGKVTALPTDGSNKEPSLSQNPSLLPQASMPSGSVGPHVSQMQQLQHHSSTVSAVQFSQPQQLQQHSSIVSEAHFSQLQQLQQPSSVSAVQISQAQQLQQHPPNIPTVQPMGSLGQQSNQQASNSTREEAETDPQKRLQATLQLAAALLQQIQQQAKTTDQR